MKGRVLIIDDEPEVRRNLTVGLAQHDYSAVACPDGISAIHELSDSRQKGIAYDYLITDVFMPDIDGLKVLKVIKSRFPSLPVLVITAFGDERLKLTALEETNTGYLDKPFSIPELVEALEKLKDGETTLSGSASLSAEHEERSGRESISAYLTIKITDAEKSRDIFNSIYFMNGVQSCEAVIGDIDIVVLAQASSMKGIDAFFDRIRSMPGVEVSSVAAVQRPKLDRDVEEFIEMYRSAVKNQAAGAASSQGGSISYLIIDIDKKSIQKIFTTVFFIDEVLFCDVVDDGTRLVGMITSQGAIGKTPLVIKKLQEIDGVLRVRVAKIIRLVEN